MISDQINQLIEQAKQHKSGESRNSMISRLKDARAHAFVMEREEFMVGLKDASGPTKQINIDLTDCTCPGPGVISASCVATKHKVS